MLDTLLPGAVSLAQDAGALSRNVKVFGAARPVPVTMVGHGGRCISRGTNEIQRKVIA